MKKGYLAGSLFNSAEVRERKREGEVLRENFKDEKWYNPIDEPINDKNKLPTATDIFLGDYRAVLESDYIIADLTNNDAGVAMELGIAVALNEARESLEEILNGLNLSEEKLMETLNKLNEAGIKKRELFCHNSDIRVANSGEYDGNYVPYGQNQFVIGGVEYKGNKVYPSFDAIVEDRNNRDKTE